MDKINSVVAEGISIQDTNFRILFQNEYHKELAGNHVGKFCYKAYRNNDRVCEGCQLEISIRDNVTCRKEQSRKTSSGVIEFEIISSPLRDSSGRIIAGIEQVREITRCRNSEEALENNNGQLEKMVEERTAEVNIAINFLREEIEFRRRTEEALQENERKMRYHHGMKLLGELAAGVAHEVRNPLHALMSVTEALKQELQGNPALDIYLFHIMQQVERLSVLMRDLLDLGKPIEPSSLRPESISDICLESIDLWKNSPARKGHRISFVQPAGKIFIAGERQRLQQVFLNLLDNATDHSPEGSEIKIVLSGLAERFVRISVVDRGAGIPEDVLSRVFEPFFSTRRGGTGLGLSIIKNILEGHEGSLLLRNNHPMPGCTAEVMLPILSEAGQ
jgi:signal transduction histidine kinase